jgi:hypothetical protein
MPLRAALVVGTVLALLAGCARAAAPVPASASIGPTWLVSGPPSASTGLAPSGSSSVAPGGSSSGPGGPAPGGSASQGAVDEPPGARTCSLLAAAIKGATVMLPGVVGDIVLASATADAPVADAAQRLSAAYATAVGAAGTDREPDAVAAVSAAAADMAGVCDDSGFSTVG